MGIWDNGAISRPTNDYVTFNNIGDGFDNAEILELSTHTWAAQGDIPEKVVPKLVLRLTDGSVVTWTAGQVGAIQRLFELAPDVGDFLSARLEDIVRSGGKTFKVFKISASSKRPEALDDEDLI